jgi:Rps23 Pro-64 3,4-dihydroxylase Tpa1-like proline 4-hydroxylase
VTRPDFAGSETFPVPFPHFRVPHLLSERTAAELLGWLDAGAPWKLRIADFYEQHEFSMLDCRIPDNVCEVVSEDFVNAIRDELTNRLNAPALRLVDVCMHRLVRGQTIRIHNDYIGQAETHRLVVQVNRGWSAEHGGFLMLFGGDEPESLTDIMLPAHRSAFGFEISTRSHHAVSTIRDGHRDSLVYTFCQSRAA